MIKALIMDVDGTLTDGKIYMGENGEAFKAFNIKDGCGIHDILPRYGIEPVIITARRSKILENRCKELNIRLLFQDIRDKSKKILELVENYGIPINEMAYIGDDIIDLECMLLVKKNHGLVGCPFDAAKEVTEVADFTSKYTGGNGAVREFIEWIIDSGLV